MEQILITVGASVFGLLGLLHLLYTFFTDKFEAFDPAVTEAMKGATPKLTRETTLWAAWTGFNASHSLGAMLVPAVYIPLTWEYFEVLQQSVWLSILPVLTGLAFLVLARKYWFRIPFFGVLISTACFAGAAILINA